LIICLILVGGEKDNPTLVFFLIFNKLYIFLCLKEIKTHLLNLDVSFKSFLRRDFEKVGLISMCREYLFFEDFNKSFKSGIGLLNFVLIFLISR
jgi:hypothetical protein